MTKLFAAISAAFAAIPGLAVLMFGLGAPPRMRSLFGGVIESFGALTLLILFVNKGKLRQKSLRRLTKWAVILGCIGFGCIALFAVLYQICVVYCPTRGTVLFPLWPTGELADMIAKHEGRVQALCDYGPTEITKAMHPFALGVTIVVLLLAYAAVSTCLAAAFGLLAMILRTAAPAASGAR
jgi:hypothetical protein